MYYITDVNIVLLLYYISEVAIVLLLVYIYLTDLLYK